MDLSETPNHSRNSKAKQMLAQNPPDIMQMSLEDNPAHDKITNPEIRAFTLRVIGNVVDQINEAVSKHSVIRNRNTWIVNAIVEQLKREKQG